MKCEACQSILEEYFDGELPAKAGTEVRAHLGVCPACAAELAELRQAHELYERYERDVDVTPALWAGIEARLKAERAESAALADRSATSGWRDWLKGLFALPHISPAFAAALVVLAIGLTVAVMSYLHSRSANNQGTSPVAVDRSGDGSANKNESVPAPKPPVDEPTNKLATAPGDEKKTNDDRPQVREPK